MALQVYNTRTRQIEPFAPHEASRVRMYVCGPTVYDEPHIGHARSAYLFDVIRKYLARTWPVQFARNVTDVDDKIIERAAADGMTTTAVAERYLASYHQAMDALGIAAPNREPKATDHLDAMIELISTLMVREMAYLANGNVYFDVRKFPSYGELSRQQLDAMQTGGRVGAEPGKRSPLDFALWKASKPGEPSWGSPWGPGRPGWHIECSAMSMHCLDTPTIDIHGGGLDLIFPHHENEVAQSEGATGKQPFAKYWLHHGLLTINGQKMAKSAGNFVTVQEAIQRHGSRALKLFFLGAHYRSPIDYSERQLAESKKMAERFDVVFQRLDADTSKVSAAHPEVQRARKQFVTALDDDFNTPAALASVFGLITWVHKQYDTGASVPSAVVKQVLLDAGDLFGLFREPENPLDGQVMRRIEARNAARKEKNFTVADTIRADLFVQGVILEDTPRGTIWRRKR